MPGEKKSPARGKKSPARGQGVKKRRKANSQEPTIEHNERSSTVRSYISGISFPQKSLNLEDTTKNVIISKMLEGLHRRNPQKDNRAPITLSLLRQITDTLPSICTYSYESLLFKSSIILAFFAMLRVSEFTTKHKSDSSTVALQLSDVALSDHQLKINIKKSKTDQRGHSTCIVIKKYTDNAAICPVLSRKKYISALPAVSGCNHLFIHFDGSSLTQYQLSAMLRKFVIFSNIPNPNLLKSHYFRIGTATEASNRGIKDETIKKVGQVVVRPKLIEISRKRVTCAVMSIMKQEDQYFVSYPSIKASESNLFSNDGSHLSTVGIGMFLNNIQAELETFKLNIDKAFTQEQ
ncbi:unnamed protein product [Mytilus coruscus]|uniref:Tyr recombinase domain-containing protein n=1 Tax=Mytilus coruscus TaxID=42192 RepID=A0A6J8CE31_MYTCO|nr:unnamed protein product [Mytilus coruscus]